MTYFSIVTVVKNDLAGLKKTRKSLEDQKYRKWTHIIIDDSSTDGTLKYIKRLPKDNTVYISEPDSGIYDAMNKGWKIANPESFIIYLNARDIFTAPTSLTEAHKAFKAAPGSNWGCTTHEEIQQDGEGWVCKLVSPPSIPNQLYAYGYRSHQAVIMKAKFIKGLGGFNEKYKIAADWELIVKALRAEYPITWQHSLGRFELGGASSSRLLEAHMELKDIRSKILIKSWKQRLLDHLWCAIYLRFFGYRNYWLPLIRLFYSRKKVHKKRRNRSNILTNSLKIRMQIWHYTFSVERKPRDTKQNLTKSQLINNKLHSKIGILALHESLGILPYSMKD